MREHVFSSMLYIHSRQHVGMLVKAVGREKAGKGQGSEVAQDMQAQRQDKAVIDGDRQRERRGGGWKGARGSVFLLLQHTGKKHSSMSKRQDGPPPPHLHEGK